MSQRLEFPIEYSFDPEAQVIIATVPSLNHISSFGKDFAEAENNIIEAVLQKDELPIVQDCASTTGTLLAIEAVHSKYPYQDKPKTMITPNNPLILKRLGQHLEQIETLCQQWGIHQLALFGSILREDFGADSDVDLLVDFSPGKKISLLDLLELEYQFSEILKRPIYLVEKQAIIQSPNWIRCQEVLNATQIIYEQR